MNKCNAVSPVAAAEEGEPSEEGRQRRWSTVRAREGSEEERAPRQRSAAALAWREGLLLMNTMIDVHFV